MMHLYERIIGETGMGAEMQQYDRNIDQKVLRLVKHSEPILIKIYEGYFKWENIRDVHSDMQIKANSETNIHVFSKDFDLSP